MVTTKHTRSDGDEILRKMKEEERIKDRERLDQKNAERKEMLENNPAYQQKLKALRSLIREGAEKVDLTFPAYWKAEVLTGFRGVLLKRDDRDVKPDGK